MVFIVHGEKLKEKPSWTSHKEFIDQKIRNNMRLKDLKPLPE